MKMIFYSDEDETHYHKKVLLLPRFESHGFWNLKVAYGAMSS